MKKNTDFSKLLLSYLKLHTCIIAVLALCTAIFCFTFYLYDLPLEATGYATLICFFVIVMIGAVDFIKYCRKHAILFYKQNNITSSNETGLIPKDIIEEDFLELIKILSLERTLITDAHNSYIKQVKDYYDMWTHQAKVPISAIRLMLDTQNEVDKTILMNEVFKLEQYIDMALYYTRLDNISSDYVIKTQLLDPIITKSIKKYSRLFITKKIKLEYEKTDIDVTTDSKWLSFVIEQILSNAIKYTQLGGKISIATQEVKGVKRLLITDTGIGIIKEDIPRIFDKGYTGFNGRGEDKSTGIGLYLCQRIAKNLNISISVESEINIGSKFIISFSPNNMVLE